MTFETFPWGALATLISGCLAVAAAWVVARRQIGLQARIAAANEMSLREKLFDRRMETFDTLADVIETIAAWRDQVTIDKLVAFTSARQRANFLFPQEINDWISRVSFEIDQAVNAATDYRNRRETEAPDEAGALFIQMMDAASVLADRHSQMVTVFARYMVLHEPENLAGTSR